MLRPLVNNVSQTSPHTLYTFFGAVSALTLVEAAPTSTMLGRGLIFRISLDALPLLNRIVHEERGASPTPPFLFIRVWSKRRLGQAFIVACECLGSCAQASLNFLWLFIARTQIGQLAAWAAAPSEASFSIGIVVR